MRSRDGEPAGEYWVDGDMMFRVRGTGDEMDRIVKIRRPFALVGRSSDSDIRISDPAVSDRHAYLHLDPRGVYVVDLLTRTGTRVNGLGQAVGWLIPGESFELAGRQITLVRVRINGEAREPEPTDADLLAETNQAHLVGVTLEPSRRSDPPWVLGSELVFLGWSSSCGIQIQDKLVARAHCALVRTAQGAYLIDLCGQNTWIGDRDISGGAARLSDGQIVTIGSASFTVHIETTADRLPAVASGTIAEALEPQVLHPSYPLDTAPADSQNALLAWMMGTIQGGQGEMLRQQGEFQVALTQLLREMQQDTSRLLSAHLARMENVDRELGQLRAEIQRHLLSSRATPVPLPEPAGPPPELPRAVPLDLSTKVPESDPRRSATWLLERVSHLETENRSAWKDLVGRLSALPKRVS